MHKFLSCLIAITVFALGVPSAALAASGTALGVDPGAQAQDQSTIRTLVVGADLFIGERVITDANGLVQIKFSDNTELVVGPRSSLVLEDYLLRDDGSAGRLAINALSGTFRFVTGGAPKDRYVINTPTGTIGVRGTAVDFGVSSTETSVLVIHGAVVLCNLAGDCVTLDGTCQIGTYDLGQSQIAGFTDDFSGEAREALRAMFPYAVSEGDLLGEFRVAEARRCLNRPFTASVPASILASDPGRDKPVVKEDDDECEGEGGYYGLNFYEGHDGPPDHCYPY